jgi:hypothetical protein
VTFLDTINRLDELANPVLNFDLTQDQCCDAALARDLMTMNGTTHDLDDWPAAREFIMRVLRRHGLAPHRRWHIVFDPSGDPGPEWRPWHVHAAPYPRGDNPAAAVDGAFFETWSEAVNAVNRAIAEDDGTHDPAYSLEAA